MTRAEQVAAALERLEKNGATLLEAVTSILVTSDDFARLLRESQPEPAAPAVGEDEALLNRTSDALENWPTRNWREKRDLVIDLADAYRAALSDLERVKRELATEKDYTQSAYLAAREAGEACGRAVDERDEARAALAAAVADAPSPRQIYDLCQVIEKIPASPEQTSAAVAASALLAPGIRVDLGWDQEAVRRARAHEEETHDEA